MTNQESFNNNIYKKRIRYFRKKQQSLKKEMTF